MFGISTMLGDARDVPAAKLGTKRGALSGSAGMAGKATAPMRAHAATCARRAREGGGAVADAAGVKARERQSRRAQGASLKL